MKKTILIFLWIGFGLEIYSMENGPMNAAWFYGEGPYAKANKYVQDRQWYEAELEYIKLLKDETGNDYDKNMARLNLASCRLAQRMTSNHHAGYISVMAIKAK